MSDVLLTYGWVRSSYAALRNLTAHGVRVCVADSKSVGMSQWSRFNNGVELYPSHYDNEDLFVERIVDICSKRTIKLIFPSHNETEVLARHRDKLTPELSAMLPDAEHCALFNNKKRAYEYARSIGVPVPLRFDYVSPDNLADVIETSGVKRTVIKLLTGNSSKGVFYALDPQSAQLIVEQLIIKYKLTHDRYPQVEEHVVGDGWGSSVLFWHGKKIAQFTHRRLREKISTGGTSTLREAARHADLEAAAERVFEAIGWHGLAMCEFKVCPITGQFWFIEVNPRMWGSIPLAISAGVEFPYLAWLCVIEGPDSAKAYHNKCVIKFPWRARWLLGDTMVAVSKLLSGQIKLASDIMFNANANVTDDFYWNDPLAFVGEALYYTTNSLSKLSLNPSEKGMLR